MAKGYVQKFGIDYEEVFAPVARMEIIRVFLALAATTTTCQEIWLARLIGELMNEEMISMTLIVDNKLVIALSKTHLFLIRSKHIKTKFHFIKICLEERKMELDFISSKNQLEDLFTKALGRLKFEELRQRLGICTV